ncbi:MAG TPA: hypothetical protein VJA21_29885 [Verrucomicrobiae bacterium]
MKQRGLIIALTVVLLLVGNGVLQWLVDDDLGIGWPHNVVRNWEVFGLSATHGQMVVNPGGYRGLEAPDVYRGHQPMSLYPVLAVKRLFFWAGSHTLPFYSLLAAGVLASVWYLLGRGPLAFLGAGLVILSPGYLIWPAVLDPNTNTVLCGIIYAALAGWTLDRPQLRWKHYGLLLVLTAVVSALNWTIALVHAQLFVWLVARRVHWRKIAVYAGAAAVTSVIILVFSVSAKVTGAHGQSRSLLETLGGYTWGLGGYGGGQSASSLIPRLVFVNSIALLPVWLLWGWREVQAARTAKATAVLAALPLGVAFLEVFTLRNYFCQHPWMAAPVFLLGGALSLSVLMAPHEPEPQPGVRLQPAVAGWRLPAIGLVAAFCFGLLIVALHREYRSSALSLVAMVRANTSRTDVLAVTIQPTLGPSEITNVLSENLDRFLLPVSSSPTPKDCGSARFLLSTTPLAGNGWILADSTAEWGGRPPRFVSCGFRWFKEHIARRRNGEGLRLAGQYYLYKIPETANNSGSTGPSAVAAVRLEFSVAKTVTEKSRYKEPPLPTPLLQRRRGNLCRRLVRELPCQRTGEWAAARGLQSAATSEEGFPLTSPSSTCPLLRTEVRAPNPADSSIRWLPAACFVGSVSPYVGAYDRHILGGCSRPTPNS